MNSKKNHIKVIAFATLFLIAGTVMSNILLPANRVGAQEEGVANLEQRLISGLRARTDKEKEYIKQVVKLVNEGKLPQKLVDGSFLWVRKKKAGHKYPFIYFQRVLTLRAKALKLEVPEFHKKSDFQQ